MEKMTFHSSSSYLLALIDLYYPFYYVLLAIKGMLSTQCLELNTHLFFLILGSFITMSLNIYQWLLEIMVTLIKIESNIYVINTNI